MLYSEGNGGDSDEKKGPTFNVDRGALNSPRPYSKVQIRALVQTVIANSVNLATLIGSGASSPAIPLMSQIFQDFRRRQNQDTKDELDDKIRLFLANSENSGTRTIVSSNIEKFGDIESFLSWLDYRVKGNLKGSKSDDAMFHNIEKYLIEKISRKDRAEGKRQSAVGNNYLKVIQGLGESRRIANAQSDYFYDVVNLFTTNYDLCHERALEASRYAYTDGFTNGIKSTFSMTEFHRRPADLENRFKDKVELVNPFFRLVKLHGSINWESGSGNDQIYRTQINNTSRNKKNVLISPTSSKYALTQNEPYSDLFREFVNTLARPNTVLFTSGFSFGDEHITKLILNALARPDFTLYAFVSRPDTTAQNGLSYFYSHAKSANAYFIYPEKLENGDQAEVKDPLLFSDFADFIAPATITYTNPDMTSSTDSSNGLTFDKDS